MSSADKNDENQSDDPEQPASKMAKKGKKKASKIGFSILSSLAGFLSRDKSQSEHQVESIPDIEEQTEHQVESIAESEEQSEHQVESIADNEEQTEQTESSPGLTNESIRPEGAKASSQTDLSARNSSTLIAISKAVHALQDVRRRLATSPKQKPLEVKLEETGNQDNTGSRYSLKNTKVSEPDMSQKGTPNGQLSAVSPYKSLSHVSFKATPEYFEKNTTSEPNQPMKPPNNDLEDKDVDVEDSTEVLLEPAAYPLRENPKEIKIRLLHTSPPTSKTLSVQTEPMMEVKGTQTVLLPEQVSNRDSVDYSGDENSLTRRIHRDRAKCSKCDLFELMLLHGGEKILNDKEMLGMFKKHMNSHLLKAQEDLNKLYKWPQRITDIKDVTEGQPHPRRRGSVTDGERVEEIAIRPTNGYAGNNFDENKYPKDELSSPPTKNKVGTPPPEKQIIINVNDDEIGTSIEKNSNTDNSFKTTKVNREETSSSRDDMRPRARSSSYDQLVKHLVKYLSSIRQRDYSDEVIIKRKHCRPADGYNGRDSSKSYDDDSDDDSGHTEKETEKVAASERKTPRINRYRNMGYKENFDGDDNIDRCCYCDRSKCLPVFNLINSGHWSNDSREDDKCDCKCYCDVGNNFCSCYPRQGDKELQLKWFIKGLLASLKDQHQNVKQTENKKEKRDVESQFEETTKNDSSGTEKAGSSSAEKNKVAAAETQAKQTSSEMGEHSIISKIAFFMTPKEDVNKRNKDGQTLGEGEQPDLSLGKQEMKNKPNSKQRVQQTENSSLAEANKSKLNSGIQNGSSGGSGNETTMLDNNFDLDDSKVQELVQDILSAYCRVGVSDRGENLERNQCDPTTDLNSCSIMTADTDEIVEQICNILKAASANAREPLETSKNAEENKKENQKESHLSQRLACSYFYSFSNDNILSNTSCNQFSCCFRSSNQGGPHSNNQRGQPLPSRKAWQRNQTCVQGVKLREECMSNCQRQRRQSLGAASNICPRLRPSTAPARYKRNAFCGCSVGRNGNIVSGNQGRYPWEPFTYVVPQSQAYWRYF